MEKVTDIESGKDLPARKFTHRPQGWTSPRDREKWQRAGEAYELLLEGRGPTEIAEALGLEHREEVNRLLDERYAYDAAFWSQLERKSLLALEMMRLDRLQSAMWPQAMMGDPRSVDSCVKIIAQRCKIAGLETVDPVVQRNLVLVVGEDEDAYIKALKAAGSD